MGIFGLPRRLCTLYSIVLTAQLASAHFRLLAPPTVGLNDDSQGSFPCGGYMPDLTAANLSDFHTDGEPVAVYLGHSQSNWLFRGAPVGPDNPYNYTTSNSSAWEPRNWEQLYPIVEQIGAENFCIPTVKAPADWAGNKGIISVISNGPDGLMYQCVAVNFVSGKGTLPHNCYNGSYPYVVEGQYVQDLTLEALVRARLPVPPNPSSTTAIATPSATRDMSGDRWADDSTSHGMSKSTELAVAICMSFAALFFLGIIVLLWRRRIRNKEAGGTRPSGRRRGGGDDGLTRPLAMRQLSRRSNAPEDGVVDPPPPYEYNPTPPSTANGGATATPGPAPPAYTRNSSISQRPVSTASPL